METLEQYRARTATPSFAESPKLIQEVNYWNKVKEYKMFTPVTDQHEIEEVIASARTRGATIAFFNNLIEFHTEWAKENEGKKFLLPLNKNESDAFYGKRTDSLYQSLNQRMIAMNLKNDWRLIKRSEPGDDPKGEAVTHLYIAHL